MEEERKFPERNEIAVCRVSKVLDYGVFVELLEFENLQAFVHISQVSTGWIKNIRNFVKEGQIRAAQITSVDLQRKHFDASFTKVSQGQQKAKINEWKNRKRNQKLLEQLAKEEKVSFETVWNGIAEPLLKEFDSLQEAFQAIAVKGLNAAVGVEKKWQKPLQEIVEKNIQISKRSVRGIVSLSCLKPNGVELIKNALIKARDSTALSALIFYKGSGKFEIRVEDFDVKLAEKSLKEVAENAVQNIKASGGTGSFDREAK